MGGNYTAAESDYGADADAALVKQYRNIFAEITAKAMPVGNDDVKFYLVPVGPIHRAAGKVGFQMFDGEQHLANAVARIRKLEAALTEIAEWDAFFYPGHKDEIPKIAKRALESENPSST